MEPINWFMKVVTQHYFDFNGRARRAEYWWYTLVYIILAIIVGVIANVVHLPILSSLLSLAFLLPSLGAAVRRLHDGDHSGWWVLIAFTGIGCLLLLYWFVLEGTKGQNQYGPDPKAAA
jgi:uncharacterized membrane protein YhaH (DUF805 family)